ncbi:hypothetical protein [Kitasatospora sp. NPDC002040]|uniref:hypothetical protein n=1 Tax=Kitasatospora sp. NPDC002040 TaxID=3154661 RepID=UPI0033188226
MPSDGGAWWDEPAPGVRWFVQLGTGAERDSVADEKLAQEVRGLPFGYRQALGAISARLSLDPLTERPAEAHDPERVRITRLAADEHGALIIATGATMSVIARVHRPTGGIGTVRVIPGP